jgi:hypothetical protein
LEQFEKRLARFLTGGPEELFGTLLLSLQNGLVRQVGEAPKQFDSLAILGNHAVLQTVAEKIFNKKGRAATQFYLQHFVDQDGSDRQFSAISDEIHEMRNVQAHQWFARKHHDLAFNYVMNEGWKRDGATLHLNPAIYFRQFREAYDGPSAQIWDYEKLTTAESLRVQYFRFLRDWLDLPKGDAVRVEIEKLDASWSLASIEADGQRISEMIEKAYGLA